MSPTSRNTLMIGGALIVIALLLTCGPMMKSWFGGADRGESELPPVAAGPPEPVEVIAEEEIPMIDETGLADAAAVGAAAGAQAGQTGLVDAADGRRGAGVAGAVTAGAAGAGAAAGSAVSAGSSGSGSAVAGSAGAAGATRGTTRSAGLPPVSAGVAEGLGSAAGTAGAAIAGAGVSATGAFDEAFGAGEGLAVDAVDAAGKVVERFAPPVAAVGGSALSVAAAAQPFGVSSGNVRRPCDSPGAGCQSLRGGLTNPPFTPGVRPTR